MEEITQLLNKIRTGDEHAGKNLLPLVYSELRRMAAAKMAENQCGNTLQPTMLVHDAWMKLSAGKGAEFESRAHFFAAAAQAMRQILVDNALRRLAQKRGTGAEHVDIASVELIAPAGTDDEILDVNESLDRFAAVEPRKAELVKLRYFVGVSIEEAASILGIAVATANRDWSYARAWLRTDILEVRGKIN